MNLFDNCQSHDFGRPCLGFDARYWQFDTLSVSTYVDKYNKHLKIYSI